MTRALDSRLRELGFESRAAVSNERTPGYSNCGYLYTNSLCTLLAVGLSQRGRDGIRFKRPVRE